jgi:hypothetical protein
MNAERYFETSEDDSPITRHNNPGEFAAQQSHSGNLKIEFSYC